MSNLNVTNLNGHNASDGQLKAWLKCQTNGFASDSFNIAALVDRGTGQFDATFTAPMSHIHYVIIPSSLADSAYTSTINNGVHPSTNGWTQNCWYPNTGNLIDPNYHFASINGRLA